VFKKIAECRGARCANAYNAVQTLCNRLESHAVAFILSMLKTNAAAWCFHSVLNSTLWQCCGNAVATLLGLLECRGRVVSTPHARCKDAG